MGKDQYKQFKSYFWSFYGKKGMYPNTLNGLEVSEFRSAVRARLTNYKLAFDGDTFDREIVRDIILAMRGKFSV